MHRPPPLSLVLLSLAPSLHLFLSLWCYLEVCSNSLNPCPMIPVHGSTSYITTPVSSTPYALLPSSRNCNTTSRNCNTSLVVLDQLDRELLRGISAPGYSVTKETYYSVKRDQLDRELLGGIRAKMLPPLHHAAHGINFEDN
jgi:hypothetical protein